MLTVKVAEAVAPVPPLVEVTAPVVLTFAPAVVPLTLTVKAQVPPTGTVALLIVKVVAFAAGAKVPPQLVATAGVASTCIPAGKLSTAPAPVKATVLPAGLESVIVKVETPFKRIVSGANDLAIVGGVITVRFAVLLAAPVPPFVDVIAPVVFGFSPATLLVTAKVTVQFPAAGTVMPVKLKAVAPATSALGIVPAQVPATAPPAAVILTSVSENEAPVKAFEALPFNKVKVTVDVPPAAMVVGAKALAIVGGDNTVTLAVACGVEPSSVVESVAEVFFTPAVVPVTFTENVQFEFAAKLAPESETVPAPCATVIVPPPHVPVTFGVAATIKPAGSVSVNETLLSGNI